MLPGDESAEPGPTEPAALAAAEARAEAARAKAEELRRRLGELTSAAADPVTTAPPVPAAPAVPRRPWAKIAASAVAIAVILGLCAATGYMLWLHRAAAQERHRTAEFQAAARQAVVNLMSMNYKTAKEDVQRLIDDSTGRFKTNFTDTAADLIKSMQDAKVMTTVTVSGAAVESMTQDSGVVLVAATSQREDPKANDAERQPRMWRVAMTLERDEGRLKLSEFGFS